MRSHLVLKRRGKKKQTVGLTTCIHLQAFYINKCKVMLKSTDVNKWLNRTSLSQPYKNLTCFKQMHTFKSYFLLFFLKQTHLYINNWATHADRFLEPQKYILKLCQYGLMRWGLHFCNHDNKIWGTRKGGCRGGVGEGGTSTQVHRLITGFIMSLLLC